MSPRPSCRASLSPLLTRPPHSVRSGLCKEACQCWDTLAPWPAAGRRPLRDACCLALSSESSCSPHASGFWALPFQSCKIIAINASCLLEALKVQRRGPGCGGIGAESGLYAGLTWGVLSGGFCPGRWLLGSPRDCGEFSCGPLWRCGSRLGPSEGTIPEAGKAANRTRDK